MTKNIHNDEDSNDNESIGLRTLETRKGTKESSELKSCACINTQHVFLSPKGERTEPHLHRFFDVRVPYIPAIEAVLPAKKDREMLNCVIAQQQTFEGQEITGDYQHRKKTINTPEDLAHSLEHLVHNYFHVEKLSLGRYTYSSKSHHAEVTDLKKKPNKKEISELTPQKYWGNHDERYWSTANSLEFMVVLV